MELFNPLTSSVKPWVIQSFLTFDSMDKTLKCDHSLENGKWFEPRSLSRLCGLIVRVRVVPRRTVVGDIDRRFDNLSGSHHQSHVNCVSSVYGIYISGQLSRDVIGCFKSNRWLSRDVIGCWFVRSCCYFLWRLIGRR